MLRSLLTVLIITRLCDSCLGNCIPDVSGELVFSPTMPVSSPAYFGTRRVLHCCMYGMKNIAWTFIPSHDPSMSKNISSSDTAYLLSEDKRHLTIKYPKTVEDTGRYRCEGTNVAGRSLAGETFLSVDKENSAAGLKMVNWSDTSTMVFERMSNHTLFCLLMVEESEQVNFRWLRGVNNESMKIISCDFLDDDYTKKCGLVQGYDGYSQIEKFDMPGTFHCQYNFTMTLNFLNISHQGSYSCEVTDGAYTVSHKFEVSLMSHPEQPILMLIGLACGFVFIALLTYVFRYDIKIMAKSALKTIIFKNFHSKRYNFFFLYNFDDDGEFKIITKVVQKLQSRGQSSYFHHRDQTYGKDTIDNFNSSLRDSCMIVIWTSHSFFDSAMSSSCMQVLISNFSDTKRVYVITSSKKHILRHSTSKAVSSDIASCMTTKSFQIDPSNTLVNLNSNLLLKWHCHTFLSWLISSLPLISKCPNMEMTEYVSL